MNKKKSKTEDIVVDPPTDVASYNHGLAKLPENCESLEADIDGLDNLDTLEKLDYINIITLIILSSEKIVHRGDKFTVKVDLKQQTENDYTMTEYVVTLYLRPGTVLNNYNINDVASQSGGFRTSSRSPLIAYDLKKQKQVVQFTVLSCTNQVLIQDITMITHSTKLVLPCDHEYRSNLNIGKSVKRQRMVKEEVKAEEIESPK